MKSPSFHSQYNILTEAPSSSRYLQWSALDSRSKPPSADRSSGPLELHSSSSKKLAGVCRCWARSVPGARLDVETRGHVSRLTTAEHQIAERRLKVTFIFWHIHIEHTTHNIQHITHNIQHLQGSQFCHNLSQPLLIWCCCGHDKHTVWANILILSDGHWEDQSKGRVRALSICDMLYCVCPNKVFYLTWNRYKTV